MKKTPSHSFYSISFGFVLFTQNCWLFNNKNKAKQKIVKCSEVICKTYDVIYASFQIEKWKRKELIENAKNSFHHSIEKEGNLLYASNEQNKKLFKVFFFYFVEKKKTIISFSDLFWSINKVKKKNNEKEAENRNITDEDDNNNKMV